MKPGVLKLKIRADVANNMNYFTRHVITNPISYLNPYPANVENMVSS
jgi:hypothetical protein